MIFSSNLLIKKTDFFKNDLNLSFFGDAQKRPRHKRCDKCHQHQHCKQCRRQNANSKADIQDNEGQKNWGGLGHEIIIANGSMKLKVKCIAATANRWMRDED